MMEPAGCCCGPAAKSQTGPSRVEARRRPACETGPDPAPRMRERDERSDRRRQPAASAREEFPFTGEGTAGRRTQNRKPRRSAGSPPPWSPAAAAVRTVHGPLLGGSVAGPRGVVRSDAASRNQIEAVRQKLLSGNLARSARRGSAVCSALRELLGPALMNPSKRTHPSCRKLLGATAQAKAEGTSAGAAHLREAHCWNRPSQRKPGQAAAPLPAPHHAVSKSDLPSRAGADSRAADRSATSDATWRGDARCTGSGKEKAQPRRAPQEATGRRGKSVPGNA